MSMTTSAYGPGYIGLTQISGDVGKLIRLGQWLNGDGFWDYEHAFVVGPDGKQIIEAEPGGAVLSPIDRYDLDKVLWLPCPPEFQAAVAAEAVKLLGTPYSFADYFALASVRLHIFPSNILLRNYVKSSKHMICSQLADAAAARGGWHIFTDGRLPQDVTPGDLTRVALEQAA